MKTQHAPLDSRDRVIVKILDEMAREGKNAADLRNWSSAAGAAMKPPLSRKRCCRLVNMVLRHPKMMEVRARIFGVSIEDVINAPGTRQREVAATAP